MNSNLLKKGLRQVISCATWFLGNVIPKDREIILFHGSSVNDYNESSRYLYEYLADKPQLKPTWVSGNDVVFDYLKEQNKRVVKHKSMSGLIHYLRAGFVVGTGTTYPSLLRSVGRKTTKICIHHASGPRQTNAGRDPDDLGSLPTSMEMVKLIGKWDYFNFTSKFTEIALGKLQLLIPKRKRVILGYPRCDHLFRRCEVEKMKHEKPLIRTYFPQIKEIDQLILYAPTWRISNIDMSFPISLFKDFDGGSLNNYLKEKKLYLLISAHPLVKRCEDFGSYDRIMYLPKSSLLDINAILPEISIIISDYSSIVTDFIIMNRPAIFVMPDYNEFLYDRGLLEDFRYFLPGREVFTQTQLVEAIDGYIMDGALDTDVRERFLKKYYDTSIQNSCERFYNLIRGLTAK